MARMRWGLGIAGALLAWVAFAIPTPVDAVPAGFQREYLYPQTHLVYPTNLEFAPDSSRIFIAEKPGYIRTAASPGGPLTLLADIRDRVHSHWDRGLLGLAIHPDFPDPPYIYALYTHGTPLDIPGGSTAVWEDGPDVDEDECPSIEDGGPGTTEGGCVVSAQLARITVDLDDLPIDEGDIEVLIHDWCQQFPSHSIGDLVFGPDGALYVSAGDGASFGPPDYGQLPEEPNPVTPRNPCGDPPAGAGGDMEEGTAQGGALRAQSLRRPKGPVVPNGAILRINPMADPGDPSTLVLPDNPNGGHSELIGKLIVAYGLRNPYRFTLRPGTNDLYIADVGYNTWEEIDRHPNPLTTVRNFGWPCYEGGDGQSLSQLGYAPLGACQDLTTQQVTAPFFAYRHNEDIQHPANDDCPPAVTGQMSRTSSSATGLAFYEGGPYPSAYDGALFGADYSRECIWVMFPGPGGIPDPDTVQVFHYEPTIWEQQGGGLVPTEYGITPVDLEMGPDGLIYGVSFMRGQLFRFNWLGSNQAPDAVIQVTPGPGANEFTLDGTGSFDPDDPDNPDALTYAWDLNGDGQYDGGNDPTITEVFPPGLHVVGLRVTDQQGASDTEFAAVINGDPPVAEITSPDPSFRWAVGADIDLEGHAQDTVGNPIPDDRLRWVVLLNHCAADGSCHQHQVTQITGSTGSFDAPDHEESSLQITLQALDESGRAVIASDTVVLNPMTVDLTFDSNIPGVSMTVWSVEHTTPFAVDSIIGAQVSVTAPETVTWFGGTYDFSHWSHGGGRIQTFTTPAGDATYTAFYELRIPDDPFHDDDGSIFEDDIEWLAARGITRGCNPPVNDEFCPEKPVTRGEMAAFFVRALGLSAGAGSDQFTDDDGHLFEAEIEMLAAAGITRGCNPPANTRFCPNDPVTRGQMAAFFVRALGLPAGASDLFADDDGHIFEAEIDRLGSAGITRGCNPPANDRYCPDRVVTRAQMAAFFHRAEDWLP